MATLRRVANVLVFGGWMLPALLARLVPARLGPEGGADAGRPFMVIAGVWAFLAVVYGVVLAARMRRGIAS